MFINPKLSGKENILALVNQADNRYRSTDLTFGRPVALDNVANDYDAHNTRITIKSTPTCMWRVNTEKTYRRLDIAAMLQRLSIPSELPFTGQTDTELATIEVWSEIGKMVELREDDVEVTFNNTKTSVTLQAKPDSYLYIGSVTMELVVESEDTQPVTQPVNTPPKQPILDVSSNRVITVRPADDTANQIMVRYASTDGTGNIDKHVRAIRTVSLSQQGPIAVWNLTGDITNDSNMSAITIDRSTGEIVIPKTILDSSEHVVVIAYKEDVPSETIEHKVDASSVVDTPRIANPATYNIDENSITIQPGENNSGISVSFDDENEVQVDIKAISTPSGWVFESSTENSANYYGILLNNSTGELTIPLTSVGNEVPVTVKTVTGEPGDLDKTINFKAPVRKVEDTSDTGQDTGTQTGDSDTQDNGGQTDNSGTSDTDNSGSDDTSENTGEGTNDGTGDNTDDSTNNNDGTNEDKGEETGGEQTGDTDTGNGEGIGNTDDQSQTPPDNTGEQDGGNDEETPPPSIPDTVSTRASLDETGSLVLTGHSTVSDTIVNITLTYQNIGPNSNVTGELENKEVNVTFNLANENDVFILSGNTDGLRPMISEVEPVAIFQPIINQTTLASNLSWSVELEDTAKHPEAPGAVTSYTLQANKNKPFVPTPPPTGLVDISQADGNVTEIRYTKNPLVRGVDLNLFPTGSNVPVKVEVRNTIDGISIQPQLPGITHDYVGDGVTAIKLNNENLQPNSPVVADVVPVLGDKVSNYATGNTALVIPEADAVTVQQNETTSGDDVLVFTKGENNTKFSLTFTKRNGETETIEWLQSESDLPSAIMMVNGAPIRLPSGSDAFVAIDQEGGRIAIKNKYISSTNGLIKIVATNGKKQYTAEHNAKLVGVVDAPSVTAVYDNTVLTVGPVKDIAVLTVEVSGQIKTFVKHDDVYKHANGETLVDTATHFYHQDETGLTIKVLGSLAQAAEGFNNFTVKATNEPLSINNNFTTDLTLWHNTAIVTVPVTAFTQRTSETPTLTVDGDGLKVNASKDTTQISVTYTDTAGTQITAVATKSGDNWTSTVPTLTVTNTGEDNSAVAIVPTSVIKKPSAVTVSVVTGPIAYTAPSSVSNTLVSDDAFGTPVTAGNLEMGQIGESVWLKYNDPVENIRIEYPEGDITLSRAAMFTDDSVVSVEEGTITFAVGTFPADVVITATATTENAWDTPSTVTYRTIYTRKPIPKATAEVVNGALVVNRNGAANLTIQYHSEALDKMNTLTFSAQNAVSAQSNTDNAEDDVSKITVSEDGAITIPHGMVKDDTIATVITSNADSRDGTNETTVQVGYYTRRTAPHKSVDTVDEYLRIYGETPDVITMKVYYRKDTELQEVVFTRGNDNDPWKLVTSVEEGLVRIEDNAVFMNAEKMDVGQTFSVHTYYAEPLDYPGTISTIVPAIEYKPKTPSVPTYQLDTDTGLTITINRSEVGSGNVNYVLPGGENKVLTFTVDKEQDNSIILSEDSGFVTTNVNDIFMPIDIIKEPSNVVVTVKGKDERDNTSSVTVELESAVVRETPRLNIIEAGDYITISGFKPFMGKVTFFLPVAETNPYVTGSYVDVEVTNNGDKFAMEITGKAPALGQDESGFDDSNITFDQVTNVMKIARRAGVYAERMRYSITSNNYRYNNLNDVYYSYQPSLAEIPEVTVTADKDDEKLRIKFSDMAQVSEVYVVYEGKTAPEREHHMMTQSYFKDKPVVITTDLEYEGQPIATYTDKEFAINRNDIKLSGTGKQSGKVTVVVTYYNYETEQTTIEKTVYAINEDDAPERLLQPISVKAVSAEKVITVTPDNSNEAIKAIDVISYSKTGETVPFSIVYNVESKTYTSEATGINLTASTGVFTLDETKLLDGSTVHVKAHNGLSGERLRYVQTSYTVVNPVEPAIATDELEVKPKVAIVNLMNAGYFTVAPANDENTNMLELVFWRSPKTEGGDVIEEVITVTRVKNPTDAVKWAIDSEDYVGVEFDAQYGLIKVTNEQVDDVHNSIVATTTNKKTETVRSFKPGINTPTLTSRDGVVTITPPNDNVTRDIIISYRHGKNKEVREVSMFKQYSGKWELFSGYSGVTIDEQGVVTIAPHEALPHTQVIVNTYVDSNGITYGPFTVVVTEPKPATKPIGFEVDETSVKFIPKLDDAELTKYIVSWSDANSEDEMYTVTKGDTWTGSGSVGASVSSTDGIMTITPISSEIKIGADIVVSAYNTQGYVTRQVFTVNRGEGNNVTLTELLVIAPAEMSSVNGDLTVRPVDDKANKMTINVLVKQ